MTDAWDYDHEDRISYFGEKNFFLETKFQIIFCCPFKFKNLERYWYHQNQNKKLRVAVVSPDAAVGGQCAKLLK